MKINIAKRLRQLRLNKEITQEELAVILGVSAQAISKWECGDSYPDITIIPSIAVYFGISLDELFGMQEIYHEDKLKNIKEQCNVLAAEGRIEECIQCLEDALHLFPDNYKLLENLAGYLFFGEDQENYKNNLQKASSICNRILNANTDITMKIRIQALLSFILNRQGKKDEAIEIANKLPSIASTSDFTVNTMLSGEEQVRHCQSSIQGLTWGMWMQIKQLAKNYKKQQCSYEIILQLYQKAIDIYKIIYDQGDYHFSHCRIQDCHEEIAKLYYDNLNYPLVLKHLFEATNHAIAFVTLPEVLPHQSLLVDKMVYRFDKTVKSSK